MFAEFAAKSGFKKVSIPKTPTFECKTPMKIFSSFTYTKNYFPYKTIFQKHFQDLIETIFGRLRGYCTLVEFPIYTPNIILKVLVSRKIHPEKSLNMLFSAAAFLTVLVFMQGAQGLLDQACSNEGNITMVDGATYQCVNGTMVPAMACNTSNGWLADGQTMKTDEYYLQCQKAGPNENMQMVAIACIKNGHMLAPSQTYEWNSVWFTCGINSDNNVVLETSGCVGPAGEKVALDATLTKGMYVFKCSLSQSSAQTNLNTSSVQLEPYGCWYGDRTYKFSDAVHIGQFWYTCAKVGADGIQLQLKGCLDENAHLLPGDVFHSRGFIFKCEKIDTGMRRSGVGCLEVTSEKTIIEHSFGDTWIEGNSAVKYVMKCNQDESGVTKTPIQCFFHKDAKPESESNSLNPGCMIKSSNLLLQCKKTDKGGLRAMSIENPSSADEADAILSGLQYC